MIPNLKIGSRLTLGFCLILLFLVVVGGTGYWSLEKMESEIVSGEIANNISQASQGIAEVNENVAQSTVVITDITRDIAGINQQSTQVGDGSGQVQLSAQSLAELAVQLENLVKKFKV